MFSAIFFTDHSRVFLPSSFAFIIEPVFFFSRLVILTDYQASVGNYRYESGCLRLAMLKLKEEPHEYLASSACDVRWWVVASRSHF